MVSLEYFNYVKQSIFYDLIDDADSIVTTRIYRIAVHVRGIDKVKNWFFLFVNFPDRNCFGKYLKQHLNNKNIDLIYGEGGGIIIFFLYFYFYLSNGYLEFVLKVLRLFPIL